MRRILPILFAVGVWASGPVAFSAPTFTDIGNSYAQKEILTLVENGVINGYGDSTFRPTNKITREEFAKLLACAMKLPLDANASNRFEDVDDWARPYVGALYNAKITTGTSANSFGARSSLTREQMAVFFVRAMKMEERIKDLDLSMNFGDANEVSPYARQAVSFSQVIKFIKGSDGNFLPGELAERQAVARLTYEFLINYDQYVGEFVKTELSGVESVTKTSDGKYTVKFNNQIPDVVKTEYILSKSEILSGDYLLLEDYRTMLQAKVTGKDWTGFIELDRQGIALITILAWQLQNSTYTLGMADIDAFNELYNRLDKFLADPANQGKILTEKIIESEALKEINGKRVINLRS